VVVVQCRVNGVKYGKRVKMLQEKSEFRKLMKVYAMHVYWNALDISCALQILRMVNEWMGLVGRVARTK